MNIAEDRLIAWLVMADFQLECGNEVTLPEAVIADLLDRGWLDPILSEPDEDGEVEGQLHLSDQAKAKADLWSPEYGVQLSFAPEPSE